eukprot:TRINITY_DN108740_c0_g1_i1.p1 TRINITY_DN108740_c0_g1~~TRINITY_DN108740_c0_g1_i1.p1  ORF type:complete len:365 (-),score=58.38 TRINITY_DN108740_c0_g1_i1:72-1097(-)
MAFEDCSHWQFKCPFRKAWIDVTPAEDSQLKEAYLRTCKPQSTSSDEALEPVSICNVGGVRFSTDFRSMLRTNLASRRSMEVRIRNGDLPFPTPVPREGSSCAAPSAASLGKEEGLVAERIAPADFTASRPGDKELPQTVRKAWGQGVPDGITLSGEFEFVMKSADKELFGEMLTWHMLSAGILPGALDNRCLKFFDHKGQVAVGSKEDIVRMMENPNSYPIKVKYEPHPAFKGMEPDKVPDYEVNRVMLRWVKDAVAEMDANLYNVKHKHQRRTFERYLLYLEDHYYQTGDMLEDAPDHLKVIERYPWMEKAFLLTNKTGPNLSKILKGEIDVLEYLFGS